MPSNSYSLPVTLPANTSSGLSLIHPTQASPNLSSLFVILPRRTSSACPWYNLHRRLLTL